MQILLESEKKRMSRFSPYSTVRPNFIVFKGITDDKGRLHEDLWLKPAIYNSDYEIALDKMNMDSKVINNLVEEDVLHFHIEYADGSKKNFQVGRCRIVTMEDLILHIRQAIVAEGLKLHVEVDRIQKKLLIYAKDLSLALPLRVARILWQILNNHVAKLSVKKDYLEINKHGEQRTLYRTPSSREKHMERNIEQFFSVDITTFRYGHAFFCRFSVCQYTSRSELRRDKRCRITTL